MSHWVNGMARRGNNEHVCFLFSVHEFTHSPHQAVQCFSSTTAAITKHEMNVNNSNRQPRL